MTTLETLFEQPYGGLDDLLLTFFDAGVSYGMGLPHDIPDLPAVASLLETVKARWHGELRASRNERERRLDDVPGWLLRAQEVRR